MADDFTCILRDEFKRFIEELPYEELRQSIFTEELEVADRLLALSERICREFVFFLRIFESRNCDISEDITELIKQLLKLYEGLTERYRERVNWLEEDRDDNSFRCQPESVDEGNARSRGRPWFSISKSQIEGLRDLGFTWSKIAAMIGVSRITLHRRIRELGLEEETRYSEIDDQELDVFVRTILALLPNSGEVMIRGALRGRGVRIQRSRQRESVQRVDPTRKQRRQRLQIRRRVYKVPGPNSLW